MNPRVPTPKSIIVCGTGRSGTTVLHNLLSHHPGVSWLSALCDRFPRSPRLNRFVLRSSDMPILGRAIRRRYGPSEAYSFWEHHSKGFSQPFRDLLSEDLSERNRRVLTKALSACVIDRRPTLLMKVTGWPRIGFLASLLPGAKFIHLVRDGRAVTNSLLNTDFWWGWRGPSNWRWGELPDDLSKEWTNYNRSFVVLAAMQWKMHLAATEASAALIPPTDFLEIKYEELCEKPLETLKLVADFGGLEWSETFARRADSVKLKSANWKWKEDLNDQQRTDLQEYLAPSLEKYGYVDTE